MVKRTRVVCPECSSGGANETPCWCHICNHKVLMLPACNDHLKSNWTEYFRVNKIEPPKYGITVN